MELYSMQLFGIGFFSLKIIFWKLKQAAACFGNLLLYVAE